MPAHRPGRNPEAPAGAWAGGRASALFAALAAAALLAGCASRSGSGGRDGPPLNPPANLAATPNAEPRVEPIRVGGPNKPYEIAGQRHVPMTSDLPFAETGGASWYGRKFHGQPTSSGEIYDMYAMTAAHKTLPIPSYARVRNPANGREVIVRVNDRGPFVAGRIVDLSYTAALKLGVLNGVAPVQLQRLTFSDIRQLQLQQQDRPRLNRPDLPPDLQPEP
jgi:rare lipoprotein A